MEELTHAHQLECDLTLEPKIYSAIDKFPFLEYPARRLYAILQIENTTAQGFTCQEAWSFNKCLCDFHVELPVETPAPEEHAQLSSHFIQRKQRTLLQMKHSSAPNSYTSQYYDRNNGGQETTGTIVGGQNADLQYQGGGDYGVGSTASHTNTFNATGSAGTAQASQGVTNPRVIPTRPQREDNTGK